MAQTRRKRQTKHRGNAAGVVESRGRTGRKPTAAEKSGKAGDAARAKEKRLSRADQPPTWRGAFLRALVAAAALVLLAGIALGASAGQTVAYFTFALILYTPISFYTDQWLYKRRMRRKTERGGGKAASR
jgi:Flp pilus assembly protein TadB